MADYLPALISELFTEIKAAWPEMVIPDGSNRGTIFTTLEALTISIVEFTKSGLTGTGCPAPPYAFIDIGEAHAEAWGTNADMQRAPVAVFFLDCDYTGHVSSQEFVSGKLWALKRAIDDSNAHTNFQPIEFGQVDTSPSNPLTNKLAAESKVSIYGGYVYWRPGWLVNIG